MDRHSGVRETRLHVFNRQMGIRCEQLAKVWLRREESQYKLNRHARTSYDRLADHDIGIDGDAIQQRSIFGHRGLRRAEVSHTVRHGSCADSPVETTLLDRTPRRCASPRSPG